MQKAISRLLGIGMLLIVGLCLGGCGDDGGEDDVSGSPPSVNVSGHWSGSKTDVGSSVNWKTGMSADLSQQPDGAVKGTVYVQGYSFTSEWPSTGIVEANRLTLTSSTGVYTLNVNGNTMAGRYAAHDWEDRYQEVSLTRTSP